MIKVMLMLDLADQTLKSLSLGSNPLPEEEDENNGADFDVVPDCDAHVEEDASLPNVQEKSTSSDKGDKKVVNIMEAASSAEGGLELSPLPKAKKIAKAAAMGAMDALRPFLRVVDPGADDSDTVAPKPFAH